MRKRLAKYLTVSISAYWQILVVLALYYIENSDVIAHRRADLDENSVVLFVSHKSRAERGFLAYISLKRVLP